MEASWRQPCLSAPRTSTPIPVWLSPYAGAGAGARATPAMVPALKSLCDGLALRVSSGVLAPSQVYRNSVIAQWRALDLDVLLTPMLGPALDLNAPGKATGEVSCPSTHWDTPACLSSSVSSAQCPAGCWEVQEKPWGRLHPWGRAAPLGEGCTLGEGPAPGELTVQLAGERWGSPGMLSEGTSSLSSAPQKLEILSYGAYGLGRCSFKSRWDLEKPRKIGTTVQVGRLPGQSRP